MRSRQDRVLRCHHLREDANILTPLLFCEKHTQPLLGFHCGEIKLLGSVLSFKGAWKLKTGVLPRMCYPYTSGVIKGFPHNLQRKSGTPCERKPPPSPFCSSAWRRERRGCRRPAGSAEEPLTPHSTEKALSWKTPASPTRALPCQPAQPRPRPQLPRAPPIPVSHRGPVPPRADIRPFPEGSCPSTCRPHGVKHTTRAAEQAVAQVCLAETAEILCGFCWQPATSQRSYSSSFLLTPLHLSSWQLYHMVFQLTPTKAVPRPQLTQKH